MENILTWSEAFLRLCREEHQLRERLVASQYPGDVAAMVGRARAHSDALLVNMEINGDLVRLTSWWERQNWPDSVLPQGKTLHQRFCAEGGDDSHMNALGLVKDRGRR